MPKKKLSLKATIATAAAVAALGISMTATMWHARGLPLPPRDYAGTPVLAAIEKRASAAHDGFPSGDISPGTLGTLLWAATGLNRGGRGWTIPTAMGRDPYVSVYVATEKGAYLYDWKFDTLKEVSKDDIRASIARQDFAKKAPMSLIFVIDSDALDRAQQFGYVAVGAMAQNVYLAAGELGVGTRYVAGIVPEAVSAGLRLREGDVPVAIMPIGQK